jgi:cytochrome d ubiquinol oxidase subunit II
MREPFSAQPGLLVIPLVSVLAIANIPREVHHARYFRAFLSSSAAVIALLALFGVGMYPYMVYSMPNPERSLDIYNAASSNKTLSIMLTIAALGVPLVLAYTASIYWVFRGKVKLDADSY